jgi:hypothetical protein
MVLALARIVHVKPEVASTITKSGTLEQMMRAVESDPDNAFLAKNVFEILKRVQVRPRVWLIAQGRAPSSRLAAGL